MDFLAQYPYPATGVGFGLALGAMLLLGKVLALAWPLIWKQTSNEGLVTKQQLDDALAGVRAEEKACQDHLVSELAAIKKALTEGDGCFAGLAESRSDMALSLRDLCRVIKLRFKLGENELDCDRLHRWIIGGGGKDRGNHA
ncbi:MAG: hypothetical protein HY794_18180 [Desulfarculus sp.]|nr:hypothetical protein [Desulfarculus sp.]